MTRKADLIGAIFGKLKVIAFAKNNRNSNATWLCECECGGTTIQTTAELNRGRIGSCGCQRGQVKNLVGQMFGRLRVDHRIGSKRGHALWHCLCSCGSAIEATTGKLMKFQVTSCGCYRTERARKRLRGEPGQSGLTTLFSSYRQSAKQRGLVFNLTLEEFITLSKGDCAYCGTAPQQMRTRGNDEIARRHAAYWHNGIDRVDNTKGYVIDNCKSCCRECNYVKKDRTVAAFIGHCLRIARYQSKDTNFLAENWDQPEVAPSKDYA